jgi:hypothetical protein
MQDNIKNECADWINVADDTIQWRALEPSDCIQDDKFLHQLSDYHLLNEGHAQRSVRLALQSYCTSPALVQCNWTYQRINVHAEPFPCKCSGEVITLNKIQHTDHVKPMLTHEDVEELALNISEQLSRYGRGSIPGRGLSFTIPAGPRQCSHFLVRVP